MKTKNMAAPAILLPVGAGLLIGAIDFLSPTPLPAILLALFGGGLLGYFFPAQRWCVAVWLGLCVPTAIVIGMALYHRPTRHHYVILDARAGILALAGAGGSLLIPKKQNAIVTPAPDESADF